MEPTVHMYSNSELLYGLVNPHLADGAETKGLLRETYKSNLILPTVKRIIYILHAWLREIAR